MAQARVAPTTACVMAGLDPAIHVLATEKKGVDARALSLKGPALAACAGTSHQRHTKVSNIRQNNRLAGVKVTLIT